MKKITVCFYEYPAALHDIDAWQKLKEDSITDIQNIGNNSTMFWLNPKPEDKHLFDGEILIATPIQEPMLPLIYDLISKNYYYKTLIFGKVTAELLRNVTKFVEEQENIKQNYKIQI